MKKLVLALALLLTLALPVSSSTQDAWDLAGNCPANTKNCPRDSSGVCTKPVSPPTPPIYDLLTFDWEIINGFEPSIIIYESTSDPLMNLSLSTPSVPSKPHKIRLTVNYPDE